MSKERLEEIKEAIAHQLGLTDEWIDGTYLFYLTRSKSAFSVGTMTLEDFTEVDEELLNEVFEAIKPFFIQQAEEKIQLEEQHKKLHEYCNYLENKNQRYEQALEFYADEKTYKLGVKISMGSAFPYHEPIKYDKGDKARQALQGGNENE